MELRMIGREGIPDDTKKDWIPALHSSAPSAYAGMTLIGSLRRSSPLAEGPERSEGGLDEFSNRQDVRSAGLLTYLRKTSTDHVTGRRPRLPVVGINYQASFHQNHFL